MTGVNIDKAIWYYENDMPLKVASFNSKEVIEYIIKLKSESLVKREIIETIEEYKNNLHCNSMEKEIEMSDVLEHFNHLLKTIKNINYNLYNDEAIK